MGTLNSSLSRRLETSNPLALGESYKILNTYYSIFFTLVIKFPIDATFTTHTFFIYHFSKTVKKVGEISKLKDYIYTQV